MQSLSLKPIGYLKSSDQAKFAVCHQAEKSADRKHCIELAGGFNFEMALKDLQGFERIWIIWWFHKNSSWRPCVLPPRGKAVKRGLFATRSPHRPNPLGISCVKLLKIEGRRLFISDCDLIDGTPIFDIKPYIPEIDSFPDSAHGWVEQIANCTENTFHIRLSSLAKEQTDWLKSEYKIDFLSKAQQILSADPSPHRTRRISVLKDKTFKMGCGPWRIYFSVKGQLVTISRVAPGYPAKSLKDPKLTEIVDQEAQINFLSLWA